MLQLLNYLFRGLGVICFLITCYLYYFTDKLQWFIITKQLTIIFFCVSILLWIAGIAASRLRNDGKE
ncbi:MAG: hypothetical protein K2X48_13365 [Chitinophagaceae bacterium]|nr:hypothetical protein [Chitinophagaceae bacterium]